MLFISVYLEEINELLLRLQVDIRFDANEIMSTVVTLLTEVIPVEEAML